MSEDYYKPRIDTFLPYIDIQPKDSRAFGHTRADIEKRRQQIIDAGKQNK